MIAKPRAPAKPADDVEEEIIVLRVVVKPPKARLIRAGAREAGKSVSAYLGELGEAAARQLLNLRTPHGEDDREGDER